MEDKSKILNIAPSFLKDFIPFISPKLFDIIDLSALSVDFSKMGFNYLFNKGVEANKDGVKFPRDYFDFITIDSKLKERCFLSDEEFGECILEFYFSQLLNQQIIFLDLRPERFSFSEELVLFEPNGLYYEFSKDFLRGLKLIYEGFYCDEDDIFERGLELLGLISPDDDDHYKSEVILIFKTHFSGAADSKLKFDLDEFRKSFHEIFSFILKHDKKLPNEFIFLGVYLVTCYMNLTRLDEALDVKKCFLRVLNN
ncbi:MAG: hypothetical protein CME61_07290 [Halobacteriovoraceae bacterium]|nr:hypothetical protein [Halobacteriovoraceae bacterium]